MSEIITINITEEAEDIVINIYEGGYQNVANADTVTNDTIPANTDRGYFFSAITGWFYVTWLKLKSLLGASGGAFAQPVYLSDTDSEIEGYKTLSYDNDAELTEVALSTDDEANVHLYADGLDVTSLPAGPYFFRFRAKVSATVGDTYLRITSFVRDTGGEETTLFTADTEIINSTSYVDVGVRTVQPAFTVNATDRYGIRIQAITTHATAKTVTYQIGDGYSAYFTTPVALRHNLLRGRDEADAHPTSAITNLNTYLALLADASIPITISSLSYELVDDDAVITCVATGGLGTLTYSLYEGETLINSNTTGIFTVSEAATYTVVVSDAVGSTEASDDVEVSFDPVPFLLLSYKTFVESDGGVVQNETFVEEQIRSALTNNEIDSDGILQEKDIVIFDYRAGLKLVDTNKVLKIYSFFKINGTYPEMGVYHPVAPFERLVDRGILLEDGITFDNTDTGHTFPYYLQKDYGKGSFKITVNFMLESQKVPFRMLRYDNISSGAYSIFYLDNRMRNFIYDNSDELISSAYSSALPEGRSHVVEFEFNINSETNTLNYVITSNGNTYNDIIINDYNTIFSNSNNANIMIGRLTELNDNNRIRQIKLEIDNPLFFLVGDDGNYLVDNNNKYIIK